MCGITGFRGAPSDELLGRLARTLEHRGPDDEGAVTDAWASIAARRLSILDLDHGHQPMSTAGGRLHIAYNGEVYNYRELRDELRSRGATFETDADTEVVLKAYELDGAASFARFNGMFAFALLDLRGQRPELVLVRDQFGIKPLYHASVGDRLVFSSEIKSFFVLPGFAPAPNDQRLYEYLRWGLHDHDQATFFSGVAALPPAHYLVVRDGGSSLHRYWEPRLSENGDPDPKRFHALLRRAVERRLVADVPVGSCLSGGLDSSSIVCTIAELLREHAPDAAAVGDRQQTFSAVFPGDPIDERPWIDAVLKMSGAQPHFTEPTSAQLMTEIGDMVWTLDEPVVSSGPYAQWAVMRLAQGKVKVLLDGQGGDELLGGYTPYRFVYLRQLLRERRFGRLLRESLTLRELRTFTRRFLRPWGQAPMLPMRYLRSSWAAERSPADDRRVRDNLKRRLLQDFTTYSLPSLLRYEDRISMARSIEGRTPFLDLELVEHVLSLPTDALMHRRWSRAIVREAMRGHLPEVVRLRQKKIGFTTPEMRWLRRERAAVTGVLRSPSFLARPYWDGAAIADAFEAACEGRMEESLFVWRVLNVELWLRVYFDRPPAEAAFTPGPGWLGIGDRRAAGLLDTDEARAALEDGEAGAIDGRHRFLAARDGTVLARLHVDADPARLEERLRPGDVVALVAAMGQADAEARVRSLQDGLAGAPAGEQIGVIAVQPGAAGSRVLASAGEVDADAVAAALVDDPAAPLAANAGAAILIRRVGRLAEAAGDRPSGADSEADPGRRAAVSG
jgi:asparagine synthase (glutamine-hydrolysing)